VVQSNRVNRHFFSIMGQRTLKYADRSTEAYDEDVSRPALSLWSSRAHDTTASPARFVLVLRCYMSRSWGILAAMFWRRMWRSCDVRRLGSTSRAAADVDQRRGVA
jgi:hypothetical protein